MHAFLTGAVTTVLYLILAAASALIARRLLTIPDELFRKLLHFILLGAYIPLVFAFDTWWSAAILVLALLVIIYPILLAATHLPSFSSFMVERKKGEYMSSMVLALCMMFCSVTLCWGLAGDRYLVLASIYAWGVGDAFAALVGKRFGRHKIKWRYSDSHKSFEGSLAMFLCSVGSVWTVLMLRGGCSLPVCILIAVIAGAVCTVAELCARGGYDTVICPTAAMVVILPLVKIFGG